MCKIRFCTLEPQDVIHLCVLYDKFCKERNSRTLPEQSFPKPRTVLSLGNWKEMTSDDCTRMLKMYFLYHTADEGLLHTEWIRSSPHVRLVYLQGLKLRNIPLTEAEEQWIASSDQSDMVLYLKHPLSEKNELKLISDSPYATRFNYVCTHKLSDRGEALLAKLASVKNNPVYAKEYRVILRKYIEAWQKFHKQRIFTSCEAQCALFADEHNDEFIMAIIKQCNMDDCILDGAVIRLMTAMDEKYLNWYLAYSYITDKKLVSELLNSDISEHIRDMIIISERRHFIHTAALSSKGVVSDGWNENEHEAYIQFLLEYDTKKRNRELIDFLKPRFKEGAVSPKMSAWATACLPELAQDALANLSLYEKRVINATSTLAPLVCFYIGAL